MENLIIKIAESEKEKKDALEVRRIVFHEEQGISVEEDIDEYEKHATRVIAYQDGLATGTARIVYLEDAAKIGRVAVLKEFRGKSMGKKIMEFILEFLKNKKIKAILNSQVHAQDFYKKLGFEPEGEIFNEANIPHVKMRKLW